MSITDPLNPALYRNLKRLFGTVRTASDGVAMSGYYAPCCTEPGDKFYVQNWGETYKVCCNICNDTRYRLHISHRWGKTDDRGRRNLWMAICFNEKCYADGTAAEKLFDKISLGGETIHDAVLNPGIEQKTKKLVEPPGPITPLHHLPPDHPANLYLATRFFDPEKLGRYYHAGYCDDSMFYLAAGRIYIPLFENNQLRSWQMRFIGEQDWHEKGHAPKYWNCPHAMKSWLVYNLDNAKRYRTGVVMEGSMKVWNLGPMGMATWGWQISEKQQELLQPHFADYSLVLLADPEVHQSEDTRKKYLAAYDRLKTGKFRHGIAVIVPPEPPDNMDRMWLREYIEKEARGQGVKVSWKMR